MEQLLIVLDIKSRQLAEGRDFTYGEGFKVLNPIALHCGI